jgi:phosphoenolpyruvate-protein phosphotransferase (PTS system enzyme I)
LKEEIFKGLPASKGIAIGKPFVYLSQTPRLQFNITNGIDADNEIKEYLEAIENSKKELSKIFKLAKEKLDDRNLLIFEAQILFLEDEDLHKQVIEAIKNEGKPAALAFIDEIRKIENKLISSNDEYIKERINDVEDIKNRVLKRLIKEKLFSKIDQNSIVIARNLTPGDTILFSNRKLLGFATDLGGTTSHVSIIARSLNVPAVVGLNDISVRIKPDDYVIVDGYRGQVIKNPAKKTILKYKEQIKEIYKLEQKLFEIEKLPTVTKDGEPIKLSVNLEFNKEIDYVVTHAKCEVGLYRTEHMFLEMGEFPSQNEQYQQYKMLAESIYPGKVTIRTFDIGGDKLLPESQKETNPFLGWRGIRIFLEKKDILMNQLRAILRASAKGNLKIMLPMVMSLEEVAQVKKLLEFAKYGLRRKRIPFDENIELGIMIEVPSAVFLADSFAKEVDFFSIGTNDLIQYILAVDRDSNIVSNLYQQFHPAVLSAIDNVIKSASRNKIPLNVCGEMAGDSIAALLLIGLGVKDLSVETTAFLKIKRIIRLLDYKRAKKIAAKALTMGTAGQIKEYLTRSYKKIIQEI